MAASGDNTVFRLLCHLAWLRTETPGDEKQQTLDWARRVYNSSVHLQFRFVYPHQPKDRVAAADQHTLARAIEDVVSLSADVVSPMREGRAGATTTALLDPLVVRDMRDLLGTMLDTASMVGWGGVHAPKEHAECDRPVNPLRLLAKWRRHNRGAGKRSEESPATTAPADEAMAELCKGLATEIVAQHSRVMPRLTVEASKALHDAAAAFLEVDIDSIGKVGRDQWIQPIATHALRRSNRTDR
jgi:hypothetical protein